MCRVCKGPTTVYRTYGRKVVTRERRCATCHEQWETLEREDASTRARYQDASNGTAVAHRQTVQATSSQTLSLISPDLGADQTPARQSNIVAKFPMLGGKEWGLEDWQHTEWVAAFPAVDVASELLKIIAWLNANPTRKKTAKGMPRFLFTWLEKNQNQGARATPGNGASKKVVSFARAAEDSRRDSSMDSLAEALLDD